MRTPRPITSVLLVTSALLALVGSPATATVVIERIEHGGGQLDIEGTATPDRDVLVDGLTVARSDARGDFRARIRGYTPPGDCTIAISDDGGTTSVEVTLPSCTPTAPPPPAGPTVSGLLVDPDTVTGGSTATGTVLLSGPAPTGGTAVTLSSDDPAADVPASVTVPASATAVAFTISTSPVPGPTAVALSATAGGVTRGAVLTVEPSGPVVSQLTVSPAVVTGGEQAAATVVLTGPAPSGGTIVPLSSDTPSVASLPPSVTVPAGSTTATTTVATSPTSLERAVGITAGSGAATTTAVLTVTVTPGHLSSLVISPDVVVGGESTTGTVTLTTASTDDLVVPIVSSDTSIATAPASATISAGTTSTTFLVATAPVAPDTTSFAEIRITVDGVTRSDTVTVTPPPTGPSLVSVTFSPADLEGGAPATGTVTLDGPATDGARVLLTSSDPAIVSVPDSVTVALGSSSAAFPVTTAPPAAPVTVTITGDACCGSVGSATGTLVVRPPTAPPQTDTVAIDKAVWKPGGRGGTLEVRATSTNPDAILTVHHTASGGFFFTLTNQGGGRYEGEFSRSGNDPLNITVRSNFGGSASADTS